MHLANSLKALFLAALMLGLQGCGSTANTSASTENTPKLTNLPDYMAAVDTHSLRLSKPKYGLAVVNDGNKVYVLGGAGSRKKKLAFYGDIEIIDPRTNKVTLLKNKITPRRYFSAVFDGKESIYIIGGMKMSGKFIRRARDLEVFNTRTHEVTRLADFKAPTRINTAVFHRDNIYVMGGTVPTESGPSPTASLFIYDTKQQRWRRGPDMPTAKATQAVLKGDYIYAVGGYNQRWAMKAFERFDIANERWESLPGLPKGVSAHSAVVVGDRLFTFGNYSTLDDTLVYDFSRGQWQKVDVGYQGARHNGATAMGNTIYVIGGTGKSVKDKVDLIQRFTLK